MDQVQQTITSSELQALQVKAAEFEKRQALRKAANKRYVAKRREADPTYFARTKAAWKSKMKAEKEEATKRLAESKALMEAIGFQVVIVEG